MAKDGILRLKNGRELEVTFTYAEGLSKEEAESRRDEVYALLLKLTKKQSHSADTFQGRGKL